MGPRQLALVQDPRRVVCEVGDRVRAGRLAGPAGAAVVEGDDPVARGERRQLVAPGPDGVAKPLDQEERKPAALLLDVEAGSALLGDV